MSLIINSISYHGIVALTDSNTSYPPTDDDPIFRPAGTAKKLFRAKHIDLVISVCGSCEIEQQSAESWLPTFLEQSAGLSATQLADALLQRLRGQQEQRAQIVHIAGIDRSASIHTAYFAHISNVDLATPRYTTNPNGFELHWDLFNRPRDEFSTGTAMFSNGFGDGREPFFRLHRLNFEIIRDATNKFKFPNITAEAEILQSELDFIGLLFSHSDYGAPVIGGDIQREVISW